MVLIHHTCSCHGDDMCAKLFINPTIHDKVIMGWAQTGFTEAYGQSLEQTVTLTFDLATRFLFPTHCLVMKIICAKLFSNPIMHQKVIGWTQTEVTEAYAQSLSADNDLDL